MLLAAARATPDSGAAPGFGHVNDESRVQRYECGAVAFPFEWQEPAATERTAFERVVAEGGLDGALYVGFPWATLIDALARHAIAADKLLQALATVAETIRGSRRAVTVCQHIHFAKYAELFEAAGITDVFWPHKLKATSSLGRLELHPFPLYPAQAISEDGKAEATAPAKRYLANFIGAYNPKVYLTDVRTALFQDIGKAADLLIVKRQEWHFDRAVYREQIEGLKPNEDEVQAERRRRDEYVAAIRESWFTLCPTGSGPSSIRIFESLAFGSIPIILSTELDLPGSRAIWREAAVIEDDSVEGYRRSLARVRRMSSDQRSKMLRKGSELYPVVAPANYRALMQAML